MLSSLHATNRNIDTHTSKGQRISSLLISESTVIITEIRFLLSVSKLNKSNILESDCCTWGWSQSQNIVVGIIRVGHVCGIQVQAKVASEVCI